MATASPQIVESHHSWYALRVRPNFEKPVSAALSHKGYDEFNPLCKVKRRWADRIKIVELPLFPGYVFCRFDPRHRLPILKTPGVVSVVSFGKELIPVEESEIEAIQGILRSGRDAVSWPYLHEGQKVRIVDGALKGLEGFLVQTKGDRRIVASVSLLQRSVSVEIARESVEPIS